MTRRAEHPRLPRRRALRLVAALTAAATIALGLPAAHAVPVPSRRVELPAGFQPEGVTTDGRRLFVGSLAGGRILTVDPVTGARRGLTPARPQRVTVGVDYDPWHDLVWAAGGPTGTIRAFDADSGRQRRVYRFDTTQDRFVNDLVVTRGGVYATDSTAAELLVVPFRDGRLTGPRQARTLPLTGDLALAPGFNLNGIVRYAGRLLAVQSNAGSLFRIDRGSGRTVRVDLGGYALEHGDGLERSGRTLYAVRNQDDLVAVVRLGRRGLAGEVVAELYSRHFDVPTTVALVGGSLWAVNARFDRVADPATADYWLARIPAY